MPNSAKYLGRLTYRAAAYSNFGTALAPHKIQARRICRQYSKSAEHFAKKIKITIQDACAKIHI
jgi:hypothetical protein